MSPIALPLRLRCGAVLSNRLAKAAMSEALADPETGAPTDQLVRLYERWSRSGAGLLLTGHVIVHPSGLGEVGNVVADERHLGALRRWAEAAQAHGSALWMQLNHAGRQSPRKLSPRPLAPSAVGVKRGGMFAVPRALTGREVEALVERFAQSAALAREAGFAGVELHAAHGYLVSQFLSPLTNLRDDAWGGDPHRRSRFLLELVRAMRAATGPTFPIGVKLNSADFQRGGFTVEESMDVARALELAGIDLLEVSGGSFESPAMVNSGELPKTQRESSREREAYFLEYAQLIRTATKTPILLTGGMRSRAAMDAALKSGTVDVIGLARPMACAPDLPARLLDGTAEAAPPVRIRSSIRAVDDLLQVAWFQRQLRRMGQGLEPDLRLGKLTTLWHTLHTSGLGCRPEMAKTPLLPPDAPALAQEPL